VTLVLNQLQPQAAVALHAVEEVYAQPPS
jgi:hypothetical protein